MAEYFLKLYDFVLLKGSIRILSNRSPRIVRRLPGYVASQLLTFRECVLLSFFLFFTKCAQNGIVNRRRWVWVDLSQSVCISTDELKMNLHSTLSFVDAPSVCSPQGNQFNLRTIFRRLHHRRSVDSIWLRFKWLASWNLVKEQEMYLSSQK